MPYIGTCFRFYMQMRVENINKAFAYRIYSHFTQQWNYRLSYVSTNLNIFETHPFTNSTLHLLSTISINKEIVAGRNINSQVVIAHQKWPFCQCSHPVWISIRQVLLVCHKKYDLWRKVVTCFFCFFGGGTRKQ